MSAYTTSLKLILPVDGEFPGTWGTAVNNQITSLVDQSVAGYLDVAMADADKTLDNGNGSASNQARYAYINMTGALTAARSVVVPATSKIYYVKNSTTGGFAITVKTALGVGVSVPNGKAMVLVCNATTGVVDAITNFSSLNLAGTLAVDNWVDGATSIDMLTLKTNYNGDTSQTVHIYSTASTLGKGNITFGNSFNDTTPFLIIDPRNNLTTFYGNGPTNGIPFTVDGTNASYDMPAAKFISGGTTGVIELAESSSSTGNPRIGGYGAANGTFTVETMVVGVYVTRLSIDTNGTTTIGGNVLMTGSTSVSGPALQVNSTTQGFRPPVMTTTQKNAISSPVAGLMVFDITLAKLCVHNGSAWQTITSV